MIQKNISRNEYPKLNFLTIIETSISVQYSGYKGQQKLLS